MALPLLEAMVPARSAEARQLTAKRRFVAIEMVHGAAGSTAFGEKNNLWAPAEVGRGFDLSQDQPAAARSLPRAPDHRQQHRRAQRRGVHAARDRRRPLPLGGGVPHAVAPAPDAGLGREGRHVARSDLRAAGRPGNADPVDAAVHRERRPGRRLLLRLLVRLHRLDQLGLAVRAAADDSRPARGVRSAVRRRRHAGGARQAPPQGQEHPRLGDGIGRTS